MTSKNLLGLASLLVAAAVGCGSSVERNEAGSGASGGGGSTSSSVATGAGGNPCYPDSCSGPTSSTSGPGGSGGGSACAGLFEAQCLAASPSCAPVYDDACCPSCDPGPCADCSNMQFHHCAPAGEVCTKGPGCGTTPTWACAGTSAMCPTIVAPDDTYACEATAGCVVATCSPDINCKSVECHPVTAGSCTSVCDGIPPSCEPGLTAEMNGSCYTGYCIPAEVCGVF